MEHLVTGFAIGASLWSTPGLGWQHDSPTMRAPIHRRQRIRHPSNVAQELREFEQKLQAAVSQFDKALPTGKDLSSDEVDAVIDLCAWAHAEWIRIHPFANGNGRTARLWANFLAMRYGL